MRSRELIGRAWKSRKISAGNDDYEWITGGVKIGPT
jgi:hypothetical protein